MSRQSCLLVLAAYMLVGFPAYTAMSETLFVVAENPARVDPCVHCDSYVVSLDTPEHILEARDIIERGGTGPGVIVIARIELGADGVNRDYLAPGAPQWSWHVAEFVDFADGAVEILDGWPSYVEEDPERWMQNTEGYMAFASYTVVQELPEPGALALGLAALAACALLARRG